MTHKTIAVIDYGMGNLHSVAKALQHVGPKHRVIISSDPQQIEAADSVVLPGVGAIRDCMAGLYDTGLAEVVKRVAPNKPFLGICIGMQTLMNQSEENGGVPCLGIVDGDVQGFGFLTDDDGVRLKVPHMGWNNVYQREDHPIWQKIDDGSRFYFVHSYFVKSRNEASVIGSATYGFPFDAVIQQGNLVATQFHPEKSAASGLQLLQNFLEWDGTL